MQLESAQQHCRKIKDKAVFENCVLDLQATGEVGFLNAYLRTLKLREEAIEPSANGRIVGGRWRPLESAQQHCRKIRRPAKVESRVYSASKPDFFRIYRVEQAVDGLRGAGVPTDRVSAVSFKATRRVRTEGGKATNEERWEVTAGLQVEIQYTRAPSAPPRLKAGSGRTPSSTTPPARVRTLSPTGLGRPRPASAAWRGSATRHLHDHPDIAPSDGVIRRISADLLVDDAKTGGKRISSMAYQPSSGLYGGMSVDLGALDPRGAVLDPIAFVTTPQWIGSVRFEAQLLRAEGLQVGVHPLPDNPHHGEVWGAFSRGQRKVLQREAQWFVPIPNASTA